ncbi:hypothetical protein ACIQVO_38825 [Streptomyces sp. NPDC101062]
MPIPKPFELNAFIANVATARGRTITLVPIPDRLLAGTSVCGLWLKHDTLPQDLILHLGSTTRFHREKIILHELGHLWCDDAVGVTSEEIDQFTRHFPADLVRQTIEHGRAAGRHRYGTRTEARAETVADLIHDIGHDRNNQIEDGVLRALDETLTHPRRRGHRD